ncbi:hypothetical protein BD410DRAFT_753717, partial [Rickenella mellea]
MPLANGIYKIKNVRTQNYVALRSARNDLVASDHGNRMGEEWEVTSRQNDKYIIQNREFKTFAGSYHRPHHTTELYIKGTEGPYVWEMKEFDDRFTICTTNVVKYWCFEDDQPNSQVVLRGESPGNTYYMWMFDHVGIADESLANVDPSPVTRQSQVFNDKVNREAINEITTFLSEKLPRVRDATFMPEHACLPGTRAGILKTINEWTMAADSIYLLTAPAGAGKSTIAHTVASQAKENGILGGCFFLHRDFNERRDPHMVINSLAFQLAHFDLEIAKNIRNILTSDPDLVSSQSLHNKFSNLIVKPIRNASELKRTILLVIDDLDALHNQNATHSNVRQDFLACIASLEPELPSVLKIFMTSRPEIDVLAEFESFFQCSLVLEGKEIQDDLKKYAINCMTKITRRYRYLGQNWPGSETILELVKKACGLFIWIHTVYLFVMQRDASARLNIVLSSQPSGGAETELDKLYTKALLDHPDMSDSVFYERFQQVVGGIAVLFDPLSSASLDALLNLSFHSDDIVSSLQSFLHITKEHIVQFIHPSFPEFLSDKTRCKNDKLKIEKDVQHCILAKACLTKMHNKLRKNICDLDSSILNTEIVDLNDRLAKNISRDLQYACQYWAHHLGLMSELNADVIELVKSFFQDDLLCWLETLSLLQKTKFTLISINLMEEKLEYYSNANEFPQLLILVQDAKKIVHEFYHLINQSAMHIYNSALPFIPQQTILYKTYFSKWRKLVKVLNGTSLQWSALITVCEGHSHIVTCMAFSPDGLTIVSGSWDKTLRLWDSNSAINKSLQGHKDHVERIAFSPDGSKVVSGSSDHTLCLWNVKSGALILDSLKAHSNSVNCVAFSPDGSHIVSSSVDNTLCLWDANSGVVIRKRLEGHSHLIKCVIFSPDSLKIVSCSCDNTLRLWNVKSGAAIGEPLRGHSEYVICAAFSPDGSMIVSGSWDNTLRLWNGDSGRAIGEPLNGHIDMVQCVAFSPDGSKIVSGSTDKTLRLWDGKSGRAIGEPLRGHSGRVNHITFSS